MSPVPGPCVSVVTPTFDRPDEVAGLLRNLASQTAPPLEVVLVDGSSDGDGRTSKVVEECGDLGFPVRYRRAGGGAALQRNAGIELTVGEFVALIDDDVRLAPEFFERILDAFDGDTAGEIGCVAGCVRVPARTAMRRARWLSHRLIWTLAEPEPGRFDWGSGHTVSRALRDPGDRLRRVDVVGGGCAVWRREAFDGGLRFSPFFRTYAGFEDFHLALVAGRRWRIYDLGTARFDHLEAPGGRPPPDVVAAHRVINSRFLFVDLVPRRTCSQEIRFWAIHTIDLVGRLLLWLARRRPESRQEVAGHVSGMVRAWRRWPGRRSTSSPGDRSDEI